MLLAPAGGAELFATDVLHVVEESRSFLSAARCKGTATGLALKCI